MVKTIEELIKEGFVFKTTFGITGEIYIREKELILYHKSSGFISYLKPIDEEEQHLYRQG